MSVYDEQTAGAIVDVIVEDLEGMIRIVESPDFVITVPKVEEMEKFLHDASHYLLLHRILDEYMFLFPIRGRTIKADMMSMLRHLHDLLERFGGITINICNQIDHMIYEINPENDATWSSRMDMGSKHRMKWTKRGRAVRR